MATDDRGTRARAGVFGLATVTLTVTAVVACELVVHYAVYHRIATLATLVGIALLVVASIGWMVWFRRLVTRHRTLERVAEATARADSEKRLVALIHNSTDVIAVLDADSTVLFVTPSAQSVLGWAPADLVGRLWIDDVLYQADLPAFVALLSQRHDELQVQVRAQHHDGRVLRLEGTMTNLLSDRAVGGIVLTVRDVTDRHELEEQLTQQGFHDSLTGLANRRLLSDRLAQAIRRTAADAANHAVIVFFDLDDFKIINARAGHDVGDRVLVEVAERLESIVRPTDTAARLGGDEFAVLLEDSDLTAGQALAVRLHGVLADEPIVVDGVVHVVTASVGLAAAESPQMPWQDVLRNADVAMYLAKDRGKGGVAVYEADLHAATLLRVQLQADLQRALREQEFVLHYQPAFDLQTGAIVGFEALVRWQRPGHGMVAPLDFIEAAERCGLIVPLGSWVLEHACTAAAAMQTDTLRPTMSVNVSAQQLARDEFVGEVLDVLDRTGLPASRLCLEITKTSLLRDLDRVVTRLSALREHGVQIAVDDFGTGYGTLSHLSRLPVDVLKVDRSFVERVTIDEQHASVTHAILAMSSALQVTTVAEGIEESAQAAWLTAANCVIGQGFLWSRPVPLDQARTMLAMPADLGRFAGAAPLYSIESVLDAAVSEPRHALGQPRHDHVTRDETPAAG